MMLSLDEGREGRNGRAQKVELPSLPSFRLALDPPKLFEPSTSRREVLSIELTDFSIYDDVPLSLRADGMGVRPDQKRSS